MYLYYARINRTVALSGLIRTEGVFVGIAFLLGRDYRFDF
jgi:hypothetical protein